MTKLQQLEKTLYYIVDEHDESNRLSKAFNYFLMALIVLSVGEMALETDKSIYEPYKQYFDIFDFFTVMVFSVEYIIRIMTSHLDPEYRGKTRWESIRSYIFSFAGIIDLVSILPFFWDFNKLDLRELRMLRLLRFLRVFKITRYNSSMKLVGDVIKDKSSEIGVIMGLIIIIMIIASFMMFYAEQQAQPDVFTNVLDCLWWAVVTMTTIGYGDVYPVTVLGKVVGSVMALLGIGLVAMPTGIISAGFLEKVNERNEKKKAAEEEASRKKSAEEKGTVTESDDHKHYCPYCGHKLD
jgi:voltage-gated potassium channel